MSERFSRPLTELASTIADGIDRGWSPNEIAARIVERGEHIADVEDERVHLVGIADVTAHKTGNVSIIPATSPLCLTMSSARQLVAAIEDAVDSAFDKKDLLDRLEGEL